MVLDSEMGHVIGAAVVIKFLQHEVVGGSRPTSVAPLEGVGVVQELFDPVFDGSDPAQANLESGIRSPFSHALQDGSETTSRLLVSAVPLLPLPSSYVAEFPPLLLPSLYAAAAMTTAMPQTM